MAGKKKPDITQIKYIPTCGSCGYIFIEPVCVHVPMHGCGPFRVPGDPIFDPAICPKCGAFFDAVTWDIKGLRMKMTAVEEQSY